jgi:hypothetical protein
MRTASSCSIRTHSVSNDSASTLSLRSPSHLVRESSSRLMSAMSRASSICSFEIDPSRSLISFSRLRSASSRT